MGGMECDWNPVKLVPSVGQSVSQSINQSINPLPCTADPADNLTRSDQIQLNSDRIRSADPCCRVSSDIESGRGVVGCGVRRGDADAMRCNPPAAADDFLFFACLPACLLACLLAGWLAGLVNNFLDGANSPAEPLVGLSAPGSLQISLDHLTLTHRSFLGGWIWESSSS